MSEINLGQTDSAEDDGFLIDVPQQLQPEEHPNEVALYPFTGEAERVASLEDVDKDAIASFHERGYLVIDRGLDETTIQDCHTAIDDLIDGRFEEFRSVMVEAGGRETFKTASMEERRGLVRKVFNFVGVESRLTALSQHEALRSVVQQIMGAEPVLLQDMALLKPARIGREKAWHQDMAYFDVPIDTTVVGVWVALDAATLENGCMHVIPGSHREGPHPHFKVRDWQICDTDVKAKASIPVPLEPGGLLFWHGLTHHGSPSNLSDKGRRGIQLHYQPEGVEKTSKAARLEIYGGEGLGVAC